MTDTRTRPDHPARSRLLWVAAAVLLGLAGGWLGLSIGGTVHHEVGPLNTSVEVVPAWDGGTTIAFPPLGELELDSHRGPLGLHARLEGVDTEEARTLVTRPELLAQLQPQAEADLVWALKMAALRAVLAAALGAALLGALALHRVRAALVSMGTALVAVGTGLAVAVTSWNPASIAEPRYTGLLTSAPSVVGSAESVVADFSRYGDQLAQIVRNVSGLATVTARLPLLPDEEGLVRVLHVSDLHLAPHAWDVIGAVARQYDVDVVVDSGDITDHGTGPENRFVREASRLGRPYVWVRGNHDSAVTERAMRRATGVVVLDGEPVEVAGLTFLGAPDPTFTPDKRRNEGPELLSATTRALAETARARGGVDVAVLHDPTYHRALDGVARTGLFGHLHFRRVTQGEKGTWFMVQGSTGGSGLRALEPEEPAAVMLSVLYLDRASGELRAYDDIRLGGLGLASAQVTRQVLGEGEDPDQVAPPAGTGPAPRPTVR